MLLGRETERAAIERLLADARVGTSGTLIVSGDPGIGKSALLALRRDASPARCASSPARGVEGEASIPFAGLLELLRPVLEHVEALPAPQAAALRAALALGPGVGGERLVIGAATLGVLASVAEERPLCVLLDDAQWIDQPSAEALLFAARRLLADPVAIVVALRSGEASPFADAGSARRSRSPASISAAGEALLARERDDAVPAGQRGAALPRDRGQSARADRARGRGRERRGAASSRGRSRSRRRSSAPSPAAPARLSRDGAALPARRRGRRDRRPRCHRARPPTQPRHRHRGAAGGRGRGPRASSPTARIEFRHPLVRSAVHNAAEPAERRAVHARARAGARPTSATRTSAPGTWARPRSAPTTRPPTRSPARRRGRAMRGAYAAASLDRRARRAAHCEAAICAGAGCSRPPRTPGSQAAASARSSLLDEAAPLAAR